MAGFKMKTWSQILASEINWFASAQSAVTDLNVGGVVRTFLEAVASELSEIYYRIFKAITDAQATAIYSSFDFPQKAATAAAGVVLFETNGLPVAQITLNTGVQVAAPATASAAQITFSTQAASVIPPKTTLDGTGIAAPGTLTFNVLASANLNAGDVLTCGSEEMQIVSVAGIAVTVTRGYGGTTAVSHPALAPIGVTGKAVTVTADVPAAAGNVGAGAIQTLVTPLTGIQAVTNPAVFTGGADLETDDSRKKRFNEFISGLARGTKGAIAFGAKQVSGVVSAVAIDFLDDGAIPVGTVNLYIADASGNASSTLLALVTTEEDNWRPAGVKINIAAPTLVPINVTAAIKIDPAYTQAAVLAAVTTNLTNYLSSLRMGQPVYRARLIQLVVDTNPAAVLNVTLTLPAADTAVPAAEIARPGSFNLTGTL